MSRSKSRKKRLQSLSRSGGAAPSAEQIAAQHTRRPDWAWFSVNVGTDKPHKAKKGKGSYSRKDKHPGSEA
ncbi:ribosome alternative rescue factor ArfA [bacterium]|nr:ribosome alternative rescue factor ArfA [bacterium]